jgi:hypothetical protein
MGRKQPDTWIFGQSARGDRRYVVHTGKPAFVAELFAECDPNGILHGLSYDLADGRSLANFMFLEEPTDEVAKHKLLRRAGRLVERLDVCR